MRHSSRVAAVSSCLVACLTGITHAQINNWLTGQVIAGTETIMPEPGMDLQEWNTDDHNLRYADLSGGLDLHDSSFENSWLHYARFSQANLSGSYLANSNLTYADLSHADLRNSSLWDATLSGADLMDAQITGADLRWTTSKGFTKEHFYSTASYKSGDLQGVQLGENNLTGWSFAGKNLSDSYLGANTILINADLSHANLSNAYLGWTYYTAPEGATLTNANLSYANLSNANFGGATLTGADLTGAVIGGAAFSSEMPGLTKDQLYTTASYQTGDLQGVTFDLDVSGWSFAGKNLSNASLPAPGADLTNAVIANASLPGLTKEQLYSTASYKTHDLRGVYLGSDLTGWDLAGQNLTGARFEAVTLTNANLTGALIAEADLRQTVSRGFTKEQLYSTASYKNGDLHGIRLNSNDLTGWDFAGKNLAHAELFGVTLTNADLSDADTRGAQYLEASRLASAITNNLILPDGHIEGLNLVAGETLPIRDFHGVIAITVDDAMTLATGSIVDIILADATWGSTITLAGGFTPDLGGTLRLGFAPGTDPLGLVGSTFDLFNWNGLLTPGDQFVQVLSLPGYQWDLTNLYTTGEVTFTAVPEPATAALLVFGGLVLAGRRRSIGRQPEEG